MIDHIDPGAEAAVVGAALIDATILDEITLDASAFCAPGMAMIWQTLKKLHEHGSPTDQISVASALIDAGDIGRVGGAARIAELVMEAPPVQSATWHAARVAECAKRRAVAAFAARTNQVAGMSVGADEMIEQLRSHLEAIDSGEVEDGPVHWSEVIEQGMAAIDRAAAGESDRGIPTGLVDLDKAIGGFAPGDVAIIGGRPRSGKSILAAQTAAHVALDLELPTLLISLEMRIPEIYNRIAASRLGINLGHFTNGNMSDHEASKLARQAGISAGCPLWVEDNPSHTIASIGSTARRFKRQYGLSLLVIDYLQLITPPKAENRQVAVSEISRGMKLLASQLEIPVILAAQLNRNSESRSGYVPALGDLRESGSLENDASIVILVHREAASDPNSLREGEADLIVAKHRNGAQSTVTVAAQLHYARFASMAGKDQIGTHQ